MQEVQKLLSNPVFQLGLKAVAPEIAIGLDLIIAATSAFMGMGDDGVDMLLSVIDERLAEVLKELATTKSKHRRREYEVRAHELLGILNEWEKIT